MAHKTPDKGGGGRGKRKSAELAQGRISEFYLPRKRRQTHPTEDNDNKENVGDLPQVSWMDRTILETTPTKKKEGVLFKDARKSEAQDQEDKLQPPAVVPLGLFSRLPPELRHLLYNGMDHNTLCRVIVSSKAMMKDVGTYMACGSGGGRRFRAECLALASPSCPNCGKFHANVAALPPHLTVPGVPAELASWHGWGRLIKALTCITATKKRIEYVKAFFDKYRPMRGLPVSEAVIQSWGQLFSSMTEDWAFMEMDKVHDAMMSFDDYSLLKQQEKFLEQEIGTKVWLENKLRSNLHGLFLAPYDSDAIDEAYWTGRLIQDLSVENRGKLFCLLYGPLKLRNAILEVDWRYLCTRAVRHLPEAKAKLGGFIDGFHKLCSFVTYINGLDFADRLHVGYQWDESEIFSLVEEVTTFPEAWAFDNFAALLLLVPKIAHIALTTRIMKGKMKESAEIVGVMKILAYRWRREASMRAIVHNVKIHFQPSDWNPFCTPHPGIMFVKAIKAAHLEKVRLLCDQLGQDPLAGSHINEEFTAHERIKEAMNIKQKEPLVKDRHALRQVENKQ